MTPQKALPRVTCLGLLALAIVPAGATASGPASYYGHTNAGRGAYFPVVGNRFARESELHARLSCVQSGRRSRLDYSFSPTGVAIRAGAVSWHQRGTSQYYGGRSDTFFNGRMRAQGTRFDGSYRFTVSIPKLHRSCDTGSVRFSLTLYKGGPGAGAEWVGATSQGRPVSIRLNPPSEYGSSSAIAVAPLSVDVACGDGSHRDVTVGPLTGSASDDFGFPPNRNHVFQTPFISAYSDESSGVGGALRGSLRWQAGGLSGTAKLDVTARFEAGETSTNCQASVGVNFKPR